MELEYLGAEAGGGVTKPIGEGHNPMNGEPLPDLSEPYSLTPHHIDKYRREGHVLLRGVASPEEVAAYRPFIAAIVEEKSAQLGKLEERDTYHRAFVQVANLWEVDERVRRFTLARRFARIAAEMMGVKGVRIWHDQALFKEPRGGPTPWHQDQYYWPLDTVNTITMWMPLVDVSEDMGALMFACGSHIEGPQGSVAISDESEKFFDNLVKEKGFPVVWHRMQAGDATFHAGWIIHSAPGNRGPVTREAMTVIYFEDGVRILEPQNPHHPADLARWLPGLKPGDLAASSLNPLVYEEE